MLLAVLSSLSLVAMVILDRLMIKDCYEGDVKQALFVSSFAGALLGLLATLIYWILGPTPVLELVGILVDSLNPYALLIMVAGAMSAQVLYHYFTCFSQEGDSTVIVSWLASTPIFVYFIGFLLSKLGILYESLIFTWPMLFAVLVTSISLAMLERISHEAAPDTSTTYRKHLFLMMLFNTTYVLLIDQTIAHASSHTSLSSGVLVAALMPFYWFGFSAGMTFMVRSEERQKLYKNKNILNYLTALLIVELLGMFVFFFEFLGLGASDSVTVSIIISLHVIPVWIISQLLTRKGNSMIKAGESKSFFMSLPLNQETLSEFSVRGQNILFQFILVTFSIIGLSLFVSLITV